ncbi:MAG: DUF4402 domain-containing protein [Alphaproteobacteria bacterium]|nr:DUF4402 domain-containing protein [Alphaproteobacteria bacterium]
MRICAFALCAFLFQLLLAGSAFAVTQNVPIDVAFETALSVTKVNDINFGTVLAGQAGTYVISTTGDVSASDGGAFLGGTTQAGSLTLFGNSTQTVDISVANYADDAGVTPSAATCAYDNGTAAPCSLVSQAAPGTGKTLLVGVTLTVDGTQNVGTSAEPSFDVVVNYH